MKQRLNWLSLAQQYWWLGGVLIGGILLWGNLPERVKRVEAGQQTQQEEITALREWTKETQGYLKGQQALNERLATQQQSPFTQTPFHSPPAPVGHPRDASPPVEELSDDGEIKVVVWTNEQGVRKKMCCNGTDCWTWHKTTQCTR